MEVRGGDVGLRGVEVFEVLVGVVELGGRGIGNAKYLCESGGASGRREVTWSTCALKRLLVRQMLSIHFIELIAHLTLLARVHFPSDFTHAVSCKLGLALSKSQSSPITILGTTVSKHHKTRPLCFFLLPLLANLNVHACQPASLLPLHPALILVRHALKPMVLDKNELRRRARVTLAKLDILASLRGKMFDKLRLETQVIFALSFEKLRDGDVVVLPLSGFVALVVLVLFELHCEDHVAWVSSEDWEVGVLGVCAERARVENLRNGVSGVSGERCDGVVLGVLSAGHVNSPDALIFESDAQNVVDIVGDCCGWGFGMVAVGQDTRVEHAYVHLLDSNSVSYRCCGQHGDYRCIQALETYP